MVQWKKENEIYTTNINDLIFKIQKEKGCTNFYTYQSYNNKYGYASTKNGKRKITCWIIILTEYGEERNIKTCDTLKEAKEYCVNYAE